MNTEHFRQDHREIHDLVQQLRQMIQSGADTNAPKIILLLVRIGEKVTRHLQEEDQQLYLPMAMSSDTQLANIAIDVQIRMGEIHEAFEEFCEVYRTPADIIHNLSGFRQDASAVFKVLHDRMRFENNELFPLLATLDKV
jgi:hemerythrin-like domain-containing protein